MIAVLATDGKLIDERRGQRTWHLRERNSMWQLKGKYLIWRKSQSLVEFARALEVVIVKENNLLGVLSALTSW